MVERTRGTGGQHVVPQQRRDDVSSPNPNQTSTNPGWVNRGGGQRTGGTNNTQAPSRVSDGESFSANGLSVEQLKRVMPHLPDERAQAMLPHLNRAMREFNIDTPARASAFLAQLAHESGELKYFEELASGRAYEGRSDLGNSQPGDGQRFKGRGPIQLTGRANYEAAGRALGIDLVNNPELASRADIGFRIAGWFWNSRSLSPLADRGDFTEITRRVNGGFNGLSSRQSYFAGARAALGAGLSGGPLATSDTPVPPTDRPGRYEMAGRYDADGHSTRMVRAYSERPGRRQYDPSQLYVMMMMAMNMGWGPDDAERDEEFAEFAAGSGWRPGMKVPEGLAQEFLAHKLTKLAENDPDGLPGALKKLMPPKAPAAQ